MDLFSKFWSWNWIENNECNDFTNYISVGFTVMGIERVLKLGSEQKLYIFLFLMQWRAECLMFHPLTWQN